jgi:elongation factor P
MLDFSEIKLGKVVVYQNIPCVITKCDFVRCQQRKPVKQCTMKNLVTGNLYPYSFKSGEDIEEADLRRDKADFLYSSGDEISFMNKDTYETLDLPASLLGDKVGYLKDGLEVEILYFNDEPISIDLPIKVSLLVTDTMDTATGNTVSNVLKEATTETGMIVRVPTFIKIGDKVLIKTSDDEYVERDNTGK